MDTQREQPIAPQAMPQGEEAPPRGAKVMAVVRWLLIVALAGLALTTWWWTESGAHAAAGQLATYLCPMHPQIKQNHPGECPICHMTLVSRANPALPALPALPAVPALPAAQLADVQTATTHHSDQPVDATPMYHCPMHPEVKSHDAHARCPQCGMDLQAVALPEGVTWAEVPGLATVQITPERLRNLPLPMATVADHELSQSLQLPAALLTAEDQTVEVHARFTGWIQKLLVQRTGDVVHAGQLLAVVASPQLLEAQQEFLNAAGIQGMAMGGDGHGVAQAARARLELFGFSSGELSELARSRHAGSTLHLRAPIGGIIQQKSAIAGGSFAADTALFTITDLSVLWLEAEVPVAQMQGVRVGAMLQTEIQGVSLQLPINWVAPTVDSASRTVRIRAELPNVQGQFRAGQWTTVHLALPLGRALCVPRSAVVDTGDYRYVFVEAAPGRFQARRVETGAGGSSEWAILAGLRAGERVVADGNFLLDSESRLAATAGQP